MESVQNRPFLSTLRLCTDLQVILQGAPGFTHARDVQTPDLLWLVTARLFTSKLISLSKNLKICLIRDGERSKLTLFVYIATLYRPVGQK